jgi:flagellar basal-body rod protein FlgC
MDLEQSLQISFAGMAAQGTRLRVVSENLANADSTAQTPGGEPYRRKVATIKSNFDRELGATMVDSGKPVADTSDFRSQYDPGNPAADKTGYVKLPNVNPLVEIMDMREAQRSYEADLDVMSATKSMLARTVQLLQK